MSKKIVLSLITFKFFMLFCIAANAQSPQSIHIPQLINYQGHISNAQGNPIDGVQSIQFYIYDKETGGNLLWTEKQNVIVTNGLFNVLLGAVTLIPYHVFSGEDRFFTLKVNADPEMEPRQRLVSVGYAFRANNADSLSGHAANDFLQKINGIKPTDGEIKLIEGNNVSIENNANDHSITISATGSGSGGGDITLPFSGSAESNSSAFSVKNTGSGRAGTFKIENTKSSNDALYAVTNGNGAAIYASAGGSSPSVIAEAEGSGNAGRFEIKNSSSSGTAVQVYNAGSGVGVNILSTGSHAIQAQTRGVDANAVYASAYNAEGVYGISNKSSGVWGKTNGTSAYGVYGISAQSNNWGYLGGSSYGAFGQYNEDGNYGFLGSSEYGVYGEYKDRGNFGYLGGTYGAYGKNNISGNWGYLGGLNGVYGIHEASGNYAKLGTEEYAVYAEHKTTQNYAYLGGEDASVYGKGKFGHGIWGDSPDHRGVFGSSISSDGVYGTSRSSYGVNGLSTENYGIYGLGKVGGVFGRCSYGYAVHGKSEFGTAIYAEGDLSVTGAYRGNITSSSNSDGAPFPKPAYDSGWKEINQEQTLTLNHNIGGNVDNYVVDLIFKDKDSSGIHNIFIGGNRQTEFSHYGAYFKNLTDTQINVYRMTLDAAVDYVRVRIWVIK